MLGYGGNRHITDFALANINEITMDFTYAEKRLQKKYVIQVCQIISTGNKMGINMMHKFLKEKTKLRNKFKHITLCADMSSEDKMFLHSYYLTKWQLVVCQVPKNVRCCTTTTKKKIKMLIITELMVVVVRSTRIKYSINYIECA